MEAQDEDKKLESYGILYTSMLRGIMLNKFGEDIYNKKLPVVCINLLSETNRYPYLFTDLKNSFLSHEGVIHEVKEVVKNLDIGTVEKEYESVEDLVNFLEEYIKSYTASEDVKGVSFFIFGTSHIDNATSYFHNLIKKHNDCLIKIVHS